MIYLEKRFVKNFKVFGLERWLIACCGAIFRIPSTHLKAEGCGWVLPLTPVLWRQGQESLGQAGQAGFSERLCLFKESGEQLRKITDVSTSGLHTWTHHPDSCAEQCSDGQRFAFESSVKVCDDGSVMLSTNNEMCLKRWEQQHRGEGQEPWPASSETFAWCSCTQVSSRTKCTSTVYKFFTLVLFFYSECWFSRCLLTTPIPLQTCTVLSV